MTCWMPRPCRPPVCLVSLLPRAAATLDPQRPATELSWSTQGVGRLGLHGAVLQASPPRQQARHMHACKAAAFPNTTTVCAGLLAALSCVRQQAVHLFGFNWSRKSYYMHQMGAEELIVQQLRAAVPMTIHEPACAALYSCHPQCDSSDYRAAVDGLDAGCAASVSPALPCLCFPCAQPRSAALLHSQYDRVAECAQEVEAHARVCKAVEMHSSAQTSLRAACRGACCIYEATQIVPVVWVWVLDLQDIGAPRRSSIG